MKIKISRSFSQKKQLAQFEPIDSFCAAEAENVEESEIEAVSEELDLFCRKEVEKTIKGYIDRRDICASCGGRASNISPLFDGLHTACRIQEGYKIKQE